MIGQKPPTEWGQSKPAFPARSSSRHQGPPQFKVLLHHHQPPHQTIIPIPRQRAMAAPSVMATELLPRFLLPRLSWAAPVPASRSARRFASVQPRDQRRSFAALQAGPAARRCSHHIESPILRRAFHATALRQRDHHFDTLKFVKRLQSEGFTEVQSVAMMKILNDVIEER